VTTGIVLVLHGLVRGMQNSLCSLFERTILVAICSRFTWFGWWFSKIPVEFSETAEAIGQIPLQTNNQQHRSQQPLLTLCWKTWSIWK